jgi:hypothetical protein
MNTMTLSDVCPDSEGAALLGESVDNFRVLARKPGFPKAMKIGHMNFRKRADLLVFKRERDQARKSK